jgi:phosphatidylglycerophosphate synthase
MFDSQVRRLKDKLYQPLAKRLSKAPPASITILALITGLICAYLAAIGSVIPSLIMWLLSRVLDGFDGLVARLHGKQSDFGGYFDTVLDFVIYAAVPIGLVISQPTSTNYLFLTIMLASFYINTASWMYLAAILEKRAMRAENTQTTITVPSGLIGGTETISIYCVFLLFPTAIPILFGIFTALVFVTILQRLLWAWKHIR